MPHYALIIGVNQDWPEQRYTHGDIGLARTLSNLLPKENLVEVYDEHATRSNILRALERLLDRRNEQNKTAATCEIEKEGKEIKGHVVEDDTLLFSYGGHGKRTQFCTQTQTIHNGKIVSEPWLKYSDIINLLERKFKGGTALCFIDCCHSGGFGEAIVQKYSNNNNNNNNNNNSNNNNNGKKSTSKSSLNVKYGCIMSVPPADTAGMEWSMTECFIRAFKNGGGDLLCFSSSSQKNGKCYYLSTKNGFLYTKNGKHPIDTSKLLDPDSIEFRDCNMAEKKRGYMHNHPTWGQVIDYLADEYGRIKGDRLMTLFRGEGMEDGIFLEKPCRFGDDNVVTRDTVSTSPAARIPRDDAWMSPFLRERHAVNDWVYVKRCGECVGGGDGIRGVGWFPGRITSISSFDDSVANTTTNGHDSTTTPSKYPTACIELHDDISKAQWTVTLPLDPSPSSSRNAVLGGLPFSYGFGFDPHPCVNVIARMASKLAYFDTTLPPNTNVKAMWPEDGKYYKARTLCRRTIPWGKIDLKSSLEVGGPYVPLQWKDDGSISFVPTTSCIVKDTKQGNGSNSKYKNKVTLAEKSTMAAKGTIHTPMDAMLASFACQGKKLHGDTPILGGSATEDDANIFWEAYDAEDFKWSRVQLMNKVDPSHLPLKVLAYHMCYRESENFSIVYWESDSTISLVPNSYLRRRPPIEKDGGKDCSDDESSVETAEEEDVRKYVDGVCQNLCEDLAENSVR